MVAAAWQGTEDADLTVLLFDSSQSRIDDDTRAIIEKLKAAGRRAILALTKIDLIRRQKLLALAQEMNELGDFTDTFMVSAVTGSGLPELRKVLAGRMPESPWLFEEDQLSDMPMRLIAAEMTREQVFLQLYQELPYAVAVETEEWEEFEDGSVRIGQAITVEREGQKAIVLGKGGSRIKAIGQAARLEIEKLLERRVHLKLFVKVRESWQDDPDHYRPWGLDYNA